jgi:transketolase
MILDPIKIRQQVLTMAYKGQSVHVPSAFSIVELLCSLYTHSIDLNQPLEEQNRFVLSKGHGTMALYAIFVEFGLLSQSDLDNYFKEGSLLHGLPEIHTPGIEATSGSLGHGFPIATGMALGLKKQKRTEKVFSLIGDGEMNEGPVWESLLLAQQHQLDNLILIVDVNKWQAMGRTADVLDLEDLTAKLTSFGFETLRCDGHNSNEIDQSLKTLTQSTSTAPKALIADTVKGRGLSFMENNNSWHYTKLNTETYEKAMQELGNA